MAKGKFERTKPHVNVGTIVTSDHGKTTLTAALTSVLAQIPAGKRGLRPDRCGAEEKARGITIKHRPRRIRNQQAPLRHVDCPGHADYVKKHITGAAQMDRRHLVCSAADGPMPQPASTSSWPPGRRPLHQRLSQQMLHGR